LLSQIINFKTIKNLNISNNKGGNLCVKELTAVLTTSLVEIANISRLELSEKSVDSITEALIKRFQQDFNLNQNLKQIIWKDNLSDKQIKQV
jgi:hypothetical protein